MAARLLQIVVVCVLKLSYLSTENITAPGKKYLPIVINTWKFYPANEIAWHMINDQKRSAMESLIAGGSQCDLYRRCGKSVGYGSHPNEMGETTLDAMVMDGPSHDVGSVGALKNIKAAMSVAHDVMLYTTQTLLVGDDATNFAVEMGYKKEDLHSKHSIEAWKSWKQNNCQPNYRQNVHPNSRHSCGPYKPNSIRQSFLPKPPLNKSLTSRHNDPVTSQNHDTIGIIVIDANGHIVAGTTTNGLIYKIPGRVGDAPITGAGAYVNNDVGAAVATGDGDIMMRFLPTYQAVAYMEQGFEPSVAAHMSIKRIIKYYPEFSGAVIAVNITGNYGAACHNIDRFPFLVRNPTMKNTTLQHMSCI